MFSLLQRFQQRQQPNFWKTVELGLFATIEEYLGELAQMGRLDGHTRELLCNAGLRESFNTYRNGAPAIIESLVLRKVVLADILPIPRSLPYAKVMSLLEKHAFARCPVEAVLIAAIKWRPRNGHVHFFIDDCIPSQHSGRALGMRFDEHRPQLCFWNQQYEVVFAPATTFVVV